MDLRPYQTKAIDSVKAEWMGGKRKTLISLPTGSGKTVVMAKIAESVASKGNRSLILAHRNELLTQAADKLRSATGLSASLEQGKMSGLYGDELVSVGSVQSMFKLKRLDKFPRDYFSVIMVDEAHHSLAQSYQTVLEHFPNAYKLGVTATPDKLLSKKNECWDSVAFEYSMQQAIEDGWLCPIKAQMIPLEIDITDVGISEGDYRLDDVGNALDPYLHLIADEMVEYCLKPGKRTVVFLPLIKTSQRFCAMLLDRGFRAAEINGGSEDREEILADFEQGKYDVLTNSMLLTEGWDCPSVDCIVNLRPTKVRSLYQQIIGRGTRLYPGKEYLLVLDFLWQTEKMDLCRPSCLVTADEEQDKMITMRIAQSEGGVDLLEADRDAQREREAHLARELGNAGKKDIVNKQSKPVKAYVLADLLNDESLYDYSPYFASDFDSPTDKQLATLSGLGIDPESVDTKGYATKLIGVLMDRNAAKLASPKQVRVLRNCGVPNAENVTKAQAGKMIGYLATHNWKNPRNGFDFCSEDRDLLSGMIGW